MNKNLPNVFANKNTGVVKNNIEKYYSKQGNKLEKELKREDLENILIRKKINDLFNSKNFVYKVNVIITTKEGDKKYTLIAKNNDTLLTINNESIKVSDIIDIKKS